MVAGDKRRKVKGARLPTTKDFDEICQKASKPRDAALIALLYLSGRRISEVLGLRAKDFTVADRRVRFNTFNEKVYTHTPKTDYTVPRRILRVRLVKKNQEPVEAVRVVAKEDKQYEYYWDTIYNQDIEVVWNYANETGKLLSHYVLDHLKPLDADDYLFAAERGGKPIGYSMGYRIITDLAPWVWPHLFRHVRFTEAIRANRTNPVAVHKFTHHKRFESTLQYLRDIEADEAIDKI